MELKQIIDILQEFNDYRRSQGKFADEKATIRDLQYSAKEIGDAIDSAIGNLRLVDMLTTIYASNSNPVINAINSCEQKISPTQDYTGTLKCTGK